MENKKPNLIIIGGGHKSGLLAIKLAELKLTNSTCEVVTIEEAKERGLTQTFEITAPKPLAEFQKVILKDNFFSDERSARNKRREAERKKRCNK